MNKGKWHEIVKYKPENYRDRIYYGDEWSSPYYLGKRFGGKIFTVEEYLGVENNYMDTLREIIIASGCKYLYIWHTSIHTGLIRIHLRKSKLKEPKPQTLALLLSVKEETRVTIDKTIELSRYCLRECVEIKFVNKSKKFAVEFGEDCYMYVKTPLDEATLRTIVTKHNLYLDPR